MTLGVLHLLCDIAVNQEVCVLFGGKPSVTVCGVFMWLFPYVLCNISKEKRGKGNTTKDMLFDVYIVDVKGQKQCFAPNNKLLNFRANYAPDFGNNCFNVSPLFSCLSPQHIQGSIQERRRKFPYTGTCHLFPAAEIPEGWCLRGTI